MGRSRNNTDVVGIDVGTGGIKVALVRDGVPIHLSQVTFGDGVVTNGELADPRLIQRILKALWQRERLPTKRVRLGLAHPASSLRPMSTPDPGNDEDLRRAIELNAGAVITGFDPTQTAFGYHILGKADAQLDVAIATLPTSVAREWARVIDRAGLELVGLELSVAATGRALLDSGTVRLVVDIGSQFTTLALVEPGNAVRFLVVIAGGGDSFTEALLPLTGGDVARAEQLKRACGIGAEPVGMVDINSFREVSTAMAVPRDILVARMSEALQVMERHGAQHPSQIILTGGGARLGGLHEAVARYLNSSAAPPILNTQLAAAPDADLYATALALSAGEGASLIVSRPGRRSRKAASDVKGGGIGRKRVPKGSEGKGAAAASASAADAARPAVSPLVLGFVGLVTGLAAMWALATFVVTPSAEQAGRDADALRSRPAVTAASADSAIQARIAQATDLVQRRVDVATVLGRWSELSRTGARVERVRLDRAERRWVVDLRAPNARAARAIRARIDTAAPGASVLPGTGPVIRVEVPVGVTRGA